MNIRFITIISNIALVSVALSSGTTIPSSTLAGGNMLIAKKSTNNPSSDVISSTTSAITTTQVTSPPSTTTIITSTTVYSHATTNSTTPSTAANTKTNNSTQQPVGTRTTLNPVSSNTTTTPVPDTTTEETVETTAFLCNCSKYITTSTASGSRPNSTTATSSQVATKTPTNMSLTTNEQPTTNVQPLTHATSLTNATETTNAIETANATETTNVAETTNVEETTNVAETTNAVEITNAVGTTNVAETTNDAETTNATETTNAAETTNATVTTNATTTANVQSTTNATTTMNAPSSTDTLSSTPKAKTLPRRRRRGVVDVEVGKIQSEDISELYDDIKSLNEYCMELCNITIKKTTTERPTTTTPKPTTTTPRHRSIDLSGKLVVLRLVIVVNETFTKEMGNKSSSVYPNLVKRYKTSLTSFYSKLLHHKFREIVILGFSKGSIICKFSLETNAPTNESEANVTVKELRDVKWKKNSLMSLTIDVNKTSEEQKGLLAKDNLLLPANVCAHHEVLDWDKKGNPECKYKCDIPKNKVYCGAHGECSFTYEGSIRCICKDGYSGNKCEIPKPTTTTAKPIKPDAIALSKIDIIGIAGGIGGGLVLILLVALCCVYTKLNKAKKRDRFYGYMDNYKEFLHDENSRIENVPDLKNEYTNLGYQTEQDELQMQRFEPEGKNVDYEPGQRQGAYERDDKSYRKVEEPEGGNVMIYQPKHLNGPMERQSGASKFDEVEERSTPYRMMDTDTTYKIRRPTVNSDRNVPYN